MDLGRGVLGSVRTAPFQQLQAFVAVARHRSFSGAARELGVSRGKLYRKLEMYGLSHR